MHLNNLLNNIIIWASEGNAIINISTIIFFIYETSETYLKLSGSWPVGREARGCPPSGIIFINVLWS